VTEAGDGEDGRIKGAMGIGTLLLDGLGDTIRVSLTEDSVYEIPVARALAEKAMRLWKAEAGDRKPETDTVDPYHFARRETTTLAFSDHCEVGPEQPPRVIVRVGPADQLAEAVAQLASPRMKETPAEGLLVQIDSLDQLAKLPDVRPAFLVLDLALRLDELKERVDLLRPGTVLLRPFSAGLVATLADWLLLARQHSLVLAAAINPAELGGLEAALKRWGNANLIVTLSSVDQSAGHALGAYRALAQCLRQLGLRAPIWIRNTAAVAVHHEAALLSRLLEASILTGGLLCDGLGDLVSFETEADPVRAAKLTYNVLQGAGARISKTEFVACPSCGRTLFDLQTTTQRIRAKTGHLKGVKIAIMGCIVNGPGEMADADFGYVGGAPGKINLYVGKNCVRYNVPQGEADDHLIALIKEHGKWLAPMVPTAP
ncbi:MAG TPA: flavodoxin-dependent (E)-4-hydroxy-3-methylbut-2-enyl-diphosphate synthase, partial [Opitutaceae bacterium]|nr:flavodoxin-dependent (E)-4-hydroxy-3-methylbut-2-enyl-diphosphate synthase [Opitutaceae bacterium]